MWSLKDRLDQSSKTLRRQSLAAKRMSLKQFHLIDVKIIWIWRAGSIQHGSYHITPPIGISHFKNTYFLIAFPQTRASSCDRSIICDAPDPSYQEISLVRSGLRKLKSH